jgi:hypothetical protein
MIVGACLADFTKKYLLFLALAAALLGARAAYAYFRDDR